MLGLLESIERLNMEVMSKALQRILLLLRLGSLEITTLHFLNYIRLLLFFLLNLKRSPIQITVWALDFGIWTVLLNMMVNFTRHELLATTLWTHQYPISALCVIVLIKILRDNHSPAIQRAWDFLILAFLKVI